MRQAEPKLLGFEQHGGMECSLYLGGLGIARSPSCSMGWTRMG